MATRAAPVLAWGPFAEKARRWLLYLFWPRSWQAAERARRIKAHSIQSTHETPATAAGVAALKAEAFWKPDLVEAEVLKLSLADRQTLVRRLDKLKTPGATTTTIQSSSSQMPPAVYAAGLAPELLSLVERYVQTPILYLGAAAKCELADGATVNQRRWHTDMEDLQVFRLIVYLSPVEMGDGPFEYLPAQRSAEVRRALRYRSGYLSEAVADLHIPARERIAVVGGPGAVFAFDGARLFHRAQPPVDRDRYSVTYSYTSRWPMELRASAKPHQQLREALQHLPPQILACVPGRALKAGGPA